MQLERLGEGWQPDTAPRYVASCVFLFQIVVEIMSVLNQAQEVETRYGSAADLRHMTAQTVFSVLDHLTKWTRHRVMVLTKKAQQAARSRTAIGMC